MSFGKTKMKKKKTVTLQHHDTSQHTVSDTQIERQRVAKKCLKRKAQGYVVTATRGRSEREREKKVIQVQSRERKALSKRHAEGLHI